MCVFALSFVSPMIARNGRNQTQGTPSPSPASEPRDEKLWKKALELHRKAIVVDTHNDILTMMIDDNYDIGVSSVGKYHTDIARMKQ